MATSKLTFCIELGLKRGAAREHRSIANMVEVLIRNYCQEHNIEVGQENGQSKK